MAKLNKDEFNKKYSDMIKDNDDLLIALMEDFSDSISNDESEELATLRAELEDAKAKVVDITERYKARFLSAIEEEPKEEEKEEEIEEKEIIDVNEI